MHAEPDGDDREISESEALQERIRQAGSKAAARKAIKQAFAVLAPRGDLVSRAEAALFIREECAGLVLGVTENPQDQLLLDALHDGISLETMGDALVATGSSSTRPAAAASDKVNDARRQREKTDAAVLAVLRTIPESGRSYIWRVLCTRWTPVASRVWPRVKLLYPRLDEPLAEQLHAAMELLADRRR